MALKSNDPYLRKAAEDEPIFVLRAKDKLAPIVVELWARMANLFGTPLDKTDEAMALASAMRHWAAKNGSKIPD